MKKINIFLGAILLSIWSVILFFGKHIGLSMLLFAIPITYYIVTLLEKTNKIKNKNSRFLIIPIIILASMYFIFNNSFFNLLNLLVIPILLIIMILNLTTTKLIPKTLLERILDIVIEPFAYIGETMTELRNSLAGKFNIKQEKTKDKKSNNIIKGLCITVPLVIIIIAILASADSVFSNMITSIINSFFNLFNNVDLMGIFIRVILIVCVFIYLSSFFYIITRYDEYFIDDEVKEENKSVDSTTFKMVLTSLNVIYLVFCIIQINSLFMQKTNINYAEYARQGFFQLMFVSVINLIVILVTKKYATKNNKYLNFMCIIMVIFTFIIIISSAVRMHFYEQAYGYTFLRLLVYCVLFAETILLIPTVLYIINKQKHLLRTYFTILIIVYIGMNFINFDAIIANRNIERYIETGKIDLEYLEEETGTDAIPELIQILDIENVDEQTKSETIRYINEVYENLSIEKMDFRDLNISKLLARKIIEGIK